VPEGGTNVPAPGDAGCPAALRISGKAFPYSSEQSRITSRGKASDNRFCCYVIGYQAERPRQYYRGRPLQGCDGPLLAATEERDDWMACLSAEVAEDIEPELRRRLAEGWRDHAAFEHGSVAAFAKLTLDLIALGAPPNLVTASQRAGLDEVRHAKLSYALASRYAGRDLGPGPLVMEPIEAPSFARIVQDTFDGGCCGETVATAIARDALEHAGDAAVKRVLTIISRDEQRHADLGWQVLAWAVRSSEEARRTLAELLRSEPKRSEVASRAEPGSGAPHGLVGNAREADIESQVMREVVRPCAEALLSSCGLPA